MSRIDYRGGLSPIKTASELKRDLTLPLYLLLIGKSEVKFPFTDRSNPSPSVGINSSSGQTVWIHWTQWEKVIAPLLLDERLKSWRHQLGSGDIRDISDLSVGFLYSCDLAEFERERPGSKNSEFLRQLGNIIETRAVESGY